MNQLNEAKISYCGLRILHNSELLKIISGLGREWERKAHHVTIKLGELPDELKSAKGKVLPIVATHFGKFDNKVIAVKVTVNLKTYNSFAHITLAVNSRLGGKPVMSNSITDWTPIKHINLEGEICEFTNAGAAI